MDIGQLRTERLDEHLVLVDDLLDAERDSLVPAAEDHGVDRRARVHGGALRHLEHVAEIHESDRSSGPFDGGAPFHRLDLAEAQERAAVSNDLLPPREDDHVSGELGKRFVAHLHDDARRRSKRNGSVNEARAVHYMEESGCRTVVYHLQKLIQRHACQLKAIRPWSIASNP